MSFNPLMWVVLDPFKKIYNSMCHRFIRENPSTKITRYNVAPLGSAAYVAVLSVENLRSAFKKSGVFPVDQSAVSKEHFTTSKQKLSLTKRKNSTMERKRTTFLNLHLAKK
ncbi:hypothetical protein DPMN_124237 [Dreissena polymorpha]|uniref:Uncharacterized protein n=1 Tax=Dreissena polymorpha TaxID=45954 RepID=A0A9D4GSB7_DREPO|nr:hypothetical protein DPMN_124237 [Dreissena polymorpha]